MRHKLNYFYPDHRTGRYDSGMSDHLIVKAFSRHKVHLLPLHLLAIYNYLLFLGIPIGAFDPEGCIFAAGIDSNIVRLYDIRTFDKGSFSTFHVQNTDKSEWKKLEFSGDGRQVNLFLVYLFKHIIPKIMITTDGGSAKLIDAFSGDVMGSIRATGAAKRVGQSCYTPDGSMIVNGDETGKVHVYDSKRGQLVSFRLPK